MGCITGLVAKIFLTVFNGCVALVGVAVLAIASVVSQYLNGFGDLIPAEINHVLNGLLSTSPIIMCVAIFGIIVTCCCHNKLFLYTYSLAGLILMIITVSFAGVGLSNLDNLKYETQIKNNMLADIKNYNFSYHGSFEDGRDKIYFENGCCGVDSVADWKPNPDAILSLSYAYQVPDGCCKDYAADDETPKCIYNPTDSPPIVYTEGCYSTLESDIGDLSTTLALLAVFFALLLLALILSTCICVKCTDALPI